MKELPDGVAPRQSTNDGSEIEHGDEETGDGAAIGSGGKGDHGSTGRTAHQGVGPGTGALRAQGAPGCDGKKRPEGDIGEMAGKDEGKKIALPREDHAAEESGGTREFELAEKRGHREEGTSSDQRRVGGKEKPGGPERREAEGAERDGGIGDTEPVEDQK
jgi:hypothetical protein